MKALPQTENKLAIYLIVALMSLLFSSWIGWRETVINSDGICYLQTAADLGMTGLRQASGLCDQAKWPFYSVLIYGLAQISHLSYLAAAMVLDGVLTLVSVISFIYLVYLLGGTTRVLWLAGLVVLFLHEFVSVRHYIVRDHGFWAFYLLSIIFLLKYFRAAQLRYALAWAGSLLLGTLFRVEGVLFLLLVPFSAWIFSGRGFKERLRYFLQLNSLTLVAGVFILLWAGQHADHLGRLGEVRAQLNHGVYTLAENFQQAALALAQHVLAADAAKDAGLVLGLLLIVWYGVSVITSVSVLYAFLVGYGLYCRVLKLDKPAQWVLGSYVLVNLMVTGAYLAENLFISQRYLIGLAFILILWVPFALDKIIQQRQQQRLFFALIILGLAINMVGGVINFGYSKNYLRLAGDWLAQNVPAKAALYSNDEQVMYYSRHFGNTIFTEAKAFADLSVLAEQRWRQYDYLALRFSGKAVKDNAMLKQINLTPIKVFANKRGDEVVIYQIIHQEMKS